jgi:uncharacterized metal-binding protein YceD (DUF177 family)
MPDPSLPQQTSTALPALQWDVDNTDVPANGMEVTKIATETERAALAQALRILSCDLLTAKYRVRRLAGDAYGVRGKFTADVVQACIVTLAPVLETVSVAFAVEFHPSDTAKTAAEGAVDLDDEVEIEPFDGKTLAIGRVIFEELVAALNPYPRRPGAEYAAPATAERAAADAKANPFAVLAKLKLAKDAPKA